MWCLSARDVSLSTTLLCAFILGIVRTLSSTISAPVINRPLEVIDLLLFLGHFGRPPLVCGFTQLSDTPSRFSACLVSILAQGVLLDLRVPAKRTASCQ